MGADRGVSVTDLAVWLVDQIAADEQTARDLGKWQWSASGGPEIINEYVRTFGRRNEGVLRVLAAAYADRPGYLEEWAL